MLAAPLAAAVSQTDKEWLAVHSTTGKECMSQLVGVKDAHGMSKRVATAYSANELTAIAGVQLVNERQCQGSSEELKLDAEGRKLRATTWHGLTLRESKEVLVAVVWGWHLVCLKMRLELAPAQIDAGPTVSRIRSLFV